MDTMIFCHKCKVEEMIDLGDAEDWRCPKCNQPERSKREDCEDIRTDWQKMAGNAMRKASDAIIQDVLDSSRCGALNIVETQ